MAGAVGVMVGTSSPTIDPGMPHLHLVAPFVFAVLGDGVAVVAGVVVAVVVAAAAVAVAVAEL